MNDTGCGAGCCARGGRIGTDAEGRSTRRRMEVE